MTIFTNNFYKNHHWLLLIFSCYWWILCIDNCHSSMYFYSNRSQQYQFSLTSECVTYINCWIQNQILEAWRVGLLRPREKTKQTTGPGNSQKWNNLGAFLKPCLWDPWDKTDIKMHITILYWQIKLFSQNCVGFQIISKHVSLLSKYISILYSLYV